MEKLAIGIRIHLVENEDTKEYLDNFIEWLKYRKFCIEAYTAGQHNNTNNPHIHMHFICQGKAITNPMMLMKRDFNLGKVGDPKFISRKYKNKINMSLQINNLDEKNIKRYLQYPLKEIEELPDSRLIGHELSNTNWTIEELCRQGHEEYKQVLQHQEKKEKKIKEKLTEWQELVEFMEGQLYDTTLPWCGERTILDEVLQQIVKYYKQRSKPPSLKLIWDRTERYCFSKGYIDHEYILYKYRR